jgi:hypothetical protein
MRYPTKYKRFQNVIVQIISKQWDIQFISLAHLVRMIHMRSRYHRLYMQVMRRAAHPICYLYFISFNHTIKLKQRLRAALPIKKSDESNYRI